MRLSLVLIALAAIVGVSLVGATTQASAHQSGCHRWHSCPSDTGSYVCGDLGYACQYPTYPTPTVPSGSGSGSGSGSSTSAAGCAPARIMTSYSNRSPHGIAQASYAKCVLATTFSDPFPVCLETGKRTRFTCWILVDSDISRVYVHITPPGRRDVVTPAI